VNVDPTSVERTLAAAGCIAPRDEANELLHAAGDDARALATMLARRIDGEPLPWIIGRIRFCELEVRVTPGVYVPRWQTEPLARMAASLMPSEGTAVDLCTGAGQGTATESLAREIQRLEMILLLEASATAAAVDSN